MSVVLLLALAALAFGIATLVQSRGRSLAGWGIVSLALIWLAPWLT